MQLLIPAGRARVRRISDQAYLFSEGTQAVSALSPAAAAAWPAFESGVLCTDGTLCAPGPCSPEVADGLRAAGAIEPLMAGPEAAPAAAVQIVDTGAGHVLVCYGSTELHARIAPEFAHMEAPAPQPCTGFVSVQQAGGRAGIALHGEPVEWTEPGGAVPLLKIAITDAMLGHLGAAAPAGTLLLHAALLGRAGRALLLPGRPGAGKSTLAAMLGRSGFALGGDDLALLQPDGAVRALPFPVTLKTGSWPLLEPWQEEIAAARTHLRPDGLEVRYLPVAAAAARAPRPAGWIVFPDRQDSGPAVLEPVPVPEALSGLIGAAWSGEEGLTPEEFSALAACLDGAACARLRYSGLAGAAAALQEFCAAAPALRRAGSGA